MKLAKGSLKIITVHAFAIRENEMRSRAGGKIFVPPFFVHVVNEEEKTFIKYGAFAYTGNITPRYVITKFPYEYLSHMRDVRIWTETRGELSIEIQYEETT
jgi:hypothetical protein